MVPFFKEHQVGAAGWVIETKDEAVHLEGSYGTVWPKEIQNACRSELSGILYILIHLHCLCRQGNILHGNIPIHCDGLSAIQSIDKYSMTSQSQRKTLMSSILSFPYNNSSN